MGPSHAALSCHHFTLWCRGRAFLTGRFTLVIPLNDLSRAATRDSEQLNRAVERVTKSGWYALGPEVASFEGAFAAYVGVTDCIGVGNGTDALTVSLLALGIGPGSRVANCANAGFYGTSAIRAVGAQPVFVDVCEDTAGIELGSLAVALDSGVDAVIVTHLYGRMEQMEALTVLCRDAGVPIVEDCAQSAGAILADRRAGSWADIGAFSFYPTKNLGALGDAGAITTSTPELAARIRSLRQYGWSDKYHCKLPFGRNSRIDEIQAAVLVSRLPDLDTHNSRRREILTRYASIANSYGAGALMQQGPGDVAHHAVLTTGDRDGVRERLAQRGIGSDIHYPIPDHRQSAIEVSAREFRLPVTERLASQVLSVPMFPELTDHEVDLVCEGLDDALRRQR